MALEGGIEKKGSHFLVISACNSVGDLGCRGSMGDCPGRVASVGKAAGNLRKGDLFDRLGGRGSFPAGEKGGPIGKGRERTGIF